MKYCGAPDDYSAPQRTQARLSVLGRQCLERRIPAIGTSRAEVTAWVAARNAEQHGIEWHFTSEEAQVKLERLYSIIHPVR
jgi:hypothetical protein